MAYAVATTAPRRVEVQLRNPQAATVAPTPMPGRPAAISGAANMTPVMPVQTPMAIAAGRAPVTAPDPSAIMAGVNNANAYAMDNFKEHHNAWESAAQGFVHGREYADTQAAEQAKQDEAAKLLGDNPDLVDAVKKGVMDVGAASTIAQQRAAAAKLEVRKSKIIDYLQQSGDHDIAGQYAAGVLDEDGVAKAVAEKDKVTKPTPTDEQRLLTQINDERKAAGKPELSMEDFLASKKGTAPVSTDEELAQLPTVQLDENGVPDPAQQDAFLKDLDPQDATLIKKMANYEMDPAKVVQMKGGDRARVAALIAQYDPTYDQNQYTARAKTRLDYTAGGKVGLSITAANTAIGHLSALYDDFTTMDNGPVNAITAVANATKSQLSDPNLAKLRTNRAAAAEELAKFFKGTGSSDMTTIAEWNSKLDETMGTDAAHAVITDIVDKLLKTKLDELGGQYSQIMGRPRDFKIISDETNGALQKMDIAPSDIDPNVADPAQGYLTPGKKSGAPAPKEPPPADTPPPDAAEEYPEGTIIEDDKGKQKIMKNGKWEDVTK